MTEPEGVVGLANRELTSADQLDTLAADSKIGIFIAFATDEDAHSPLMLSVYDELEKAFDGIIPLHTVQVFPNGHDNYDVDLASKFLITAVPTLVWYDVKVKYEDEDSSWKGSATYLRMVGTTMQGKLEKEVNDKIEEILANA